VDVRVNPQTWEELRGQNILRNKIR